MKRRDGKALDRSVKDGLRLEAAGDPAGAEARYRKVLARDPEHVGANTQLGALLAQDGRLQEAVEPLEAAVARFSDAGVWNNLGHVYRELGRLEEARGAFRRVCGAKGPAGWYGLGTVAQRDGRLDDARGSYERALTVDPDFVLAREALATVHELAGRPREAIAVLTEVLARHGHRAGLRRRLGVLHALHGSAPVGQAFLKGALVDDPDDPVVPHMLAALGGENPEAPDSRFVEAVFDAFADGYEAHLTGALQTRVPEWVASVLPERCGRLLDLGCGSGLALVPLAGRFEEAVGVDLSGRMLHAAWASGRYDALHQAELTAWLAECETPFDTVVAADVFAYQGTLDAVFAAVRRVCTERFVFTVESRDKADFALGVEGRYSHSESYIRRCAEQAGFSIEHLAERPLRREKGAWVTGLVVGLVPHAP